MMMIIIGVTVSFSTQCQSKMIHTSRIEFVLTGALDLHFFGHAQPFGIENTTLTYSH